MKSTLVLLSLFFAAVLSSCNQQKPATNENLSKRIIAADDAPAAIGPYSQGVLVGNILYCSGQIAIDPKSGQLITGDIQAETHQVLKNLGAVLRTAGMDYENVVQATVFMKSMDDYAKINEIYGQYFGKNPPARAAVQVAKLPKDVGVEIIVVAVK